MNTSTISHDGDSPKLPEDESPKISPEVLGGIFHTPSMEISKKIDALRDSWPEDEIYPDEFYRLAVVVDGLREALSCGGDGIEQSQNVMSAAGTFIRAAEMRGHVEVANLLKEYATAALACCNRK